MMAVFKYNKEEEIKMSLKEQLMNDLKEAMKDKDISRKNTVQITFLRGKEGQ